MLQSVKQFSAVGDEFTLKTRVIRLVNLTEDLIFSKWDLYRVSCTQKEIDMARLIIAFLVQQHISYSFYYPINLNTQLMIVIIYRRL